MTINKEKPVNHGEHTNTAIEMIRILLESGGSPIDMIDTMAHLTGMVCCGLAFSVKGDVKARRKAYQVQQDIAKATRKSIERQPAEAFQHLSFESMFIDDDTLNEPPAIEQKQDEDEAKNDTQKED